MQLKLLLWNMEWMNDLFAQRVTGPGRIPSRRAETGALPGQRDGEKKQPGGGTSRP